MKRRIQLSNERDILRWGYEERGIFTMREAYKLIIKEHMVKYPLWSKVWDPTNWPKISTFLWLLCHKKILTWDNLRKRSFHGPSMCPNCRQEEESIKHLMHSCHIARKLWEKKEINRRIFKDHSAPLENIWKIICQNIEETISLQTWYQEDLPTIPQEQSIWVNWNLQWNQEQVVKGTRPPMGCSPEKWLPPPMHMFQLNFDGASKGNPGNSGFGGIFRDYKSAPLLSFLGSKGWDTNNSAELEGIWQGLILAQNKGFSLLIIEGDS
eukprot:PITA_28336